MKKLTQEKLKELLYYNPDTGIFTWKVSRGRVKLGDIAGTTTKQGYIVININGKPHRAHRLAFLYVEGNIPEYPRYEIDHKDRVKTNNIWSNLKITNRLNNELNKSLQKNNKSGVVGVNYYKSQGTWRASIKVKGKSIYLGTYKDKTDAILARHNAEQVFGYSKTEIAG